ncbi:MAG: tetratricopeptide repeat-containing sulfotransferase family protein [Luteimonas sp.]
MLDASSNALTRRYREAVAALNKSDWRQAQHLSMELLRDAPAHAGVCFVAGVAALQLHQILLAIECLRRATELNPTRAEYMAQCARALLHAALPAEAIDAADKARALSPSDPMTLDTLGIVYSQLNAHEKAAEMFRRVAVLQPESANCRFNIATSLIFSGDIDAAEHELEACLELDPGCWKAHLSIALLRRQTGFANHLERLLALLAGAAGDETAQMYLNLSLYKEYEDLADYPQAFAHLTRGKLAGSSSRGYSIERDEALFAALIDSFPAPQPEASGFRTTEPIFVFGMPRTGTTLVERIISSHPEVYSAGELQDFGIALKRASGSRTRPVLDLDTVRRSREIDRARLGGQYLESTRPGTGKTPRFIDKLPHNFLYAGYIAQALPDAKLVCLRRDPVDTCLGNFRQLFAQNSPYYDYSFDLLDTGRYYVLFDRLMAHWRRVLPGRILELDYETLVDEQEASTRRLLEFCGLHWDAACLDFQDNAAPVATASAVQVRSPMYRSAVGRWRRYEPQLGELLQLLHEAGIPHGEVA